MSHWIIYGLLIYVLWKMLVRIVFPAVQISNSMNKQMHEMQEKMRQMEQEKQAENARMKARKEAKKEGEYIDFEEVKGA